MLCSFCEISQLSLGVACRSLVRKIWPQSKCLNILMVLFEYCVIRSRGIWSRRFTLAILISCSVNTRNYCRQVGAICDKASLGCLSVCLDCMLALRMAVRVL